MFKLEENGIPVYLEGEIAENTDPEFCGRVRVHIIGRTEEMQVEDLPFARILHPLSDGLDLSDPVCEIGTRVLMMMFNNDYNSLIILGQFKKVSQTY